tara:strand:- start:298 stop:1458 length:1161 start_codon:yes stop_codon:yes gene_type:complete
MYKKIFWTFKKPKKINSNSKYLTLRDINHLDRIYNKYDLKIESFDSCLVDYILNYSKFSRYIIKELDLLIKVDGKFKIKGFIINNHLGLLRSESQIKNEFSLSTNNRYILIDECKIGKTFELTYKKIKSIIIPEDNIHSWSFGIITNGKKKESVINLIDSIKSQNIKNYEIIICGPNFSTDDKRVINIGDVHNINDIRGPICHKKNRIIKKCKYENVAIFHDRYILPTDWFVNMKNYGNFFELLSMPNIGPFGGRVNDYTFFPAKPFQKKFKFNPLRNYNYWSDDWYSQGGVIISKKRILLDNLLDENLYWGELEDVAFSQILNLKGYFFYFDTKNKLHTDSSRIKESKIKHGIFYLLWLNFSFFKFSFVSFKDYLMFIYEIFRKN